MLIFLPGRILAQPSPLPVQPDFSIVLLPDTQNEADFFPAVLASQTAWVASRRAALNIQAVLGLGDIVNDGAADLQQQNASLAIQTLDSAGIPYFLAIGNHDYDGAVPRVATGFNRWFGPARYAAYSYYKGNYPAGSNENFYGVLTIGGKSYLFLMLEFVPRNASLVWAASIIAANPDKEVIIVTHSYMYSDNTRVDRCDSEDMSADNNGDATWSKLVSQYANVIMVVSGHITNGNGARRADLGVHKNLVNQIFSNYQTLANGGDGWLRILKFHPSLNTIDVLTYSPYLNSYKTDAANQFTVYYHDPEFPAGGLGSVNGLVRDSDTCARIPTASISTAGTTTAVDATGHYSVILPDTDKVALTATAAGWTPETLNTPVNRGYSTDLNFFLKLPLPPACIVNPANRTVTICTPINGASIKSPVALIATSTDSGMVTRTQVFVDGIGGANIDSGTLRASIPMIAGLRQLTVQSTDAIGFFKQTISINVLPGVAVSPLAVAFGGIKVGSSSPSHPVSLTASGGMTIGSVRTTGDFTQNNLCGSSLVPGASCVINVMLTPTLLGVRTGALIVTDSDLSSPESIALSGTGLVSAGCLPGPVDPSVTLCAPINNATVASPIHVSASTTDSTPVVLMQIYIDGVAVYNQLATYLESDVPLTVGIHRVSVQAKDSTGMLFKQSISVTVP